MLENVKMKSEWADLISSHLGVNYIYINSSDFSAQIRSRYYWCNWEVPSWNDKGILLKDIITDGNDWINNTPGLAVSAFSF